MKTFCLSVLIFFSSYFSSHLMGQRIQLSIGDIIPNITLKNVINYKKNSLQISDFRGKLLILEFWATWCNPCIRAFPKNDSLEKKYQGKLRFLPITYEKQQDVLLFFQKFQKIRGMQPISVIEDTLFKKIFPFTSLPHYVWINGFGKIIAITQGEAITDENIQSAIKGKTFEFVSKQDDNIRIVNRPVFMPFVQIERSGILSLKPIDANNIKMYSIVTKYIDGLHSGMSIRDTALLISNTTISQLYKYAIFGSGLQSLNTSTMEIEIPDSTLHTWVTARKPSGKEFLSPGIETVIWLKEFGYCCEVKVPNYMSNEKGTLMLAELNRYFGALYGIECEIKKRNKKYLALTRVGIEDLLHSKGGESLTQKNAYFLKLQNVSLSYIIADLAIPLQFYPQIIDETGYKNKIDIELNCELSDLKSVNRELNNYGLQLIEKEKMMDVAVISMKRTEK